MISADTVGVDDAVLAVGTGVVVGVGWAVAAVVVAAVVVVVAALRSIGVIEALLLTLARADGVDVGAIFLKSGREGVDVWRVVLRKRWG